jgi:hypothetical protein
MRGASAITEETSVRDRVTDTIVDKLNNRVTSSDLEFY